MDIANGTHEYYLNKPIMVHFAGEGEKEVILLELHEPTRAHVKKSSRMKQFIMQAMMEVSEKSQNEVVGHEQKLLHEKTDEDIEKESLEMKKALGMMLQMSKTVDIGNFIELFIDMALKNSKKSIIMCDGKIPIKDIHFDQMSANDIEELAITYASFFLMPSEMQVA